MSYRVQFEGQALVQLKGLPQAIFDALVERVTDLVREPWDADLMTPGGYPAYRRPYSATDTGCSHFSR